MPPFIYNVLLAAQASSDALPEGRILGLDAQFLKEMAFQWVNLIVLTVALIFILHKPVKKFLDERAKRIQGELDAADEERKQANILKEKYERELESLEKDRDKIMQAEYKKALNESDKILFNAQKEADLIHTRAMADIELEKKNARKEIKQNIIELSSLMANRFVTVSIDDETRDKYIDDAFADWEE